jgi:hypothetical protein
VQLRPDRSVREPVSPKVSFCWSSIREMVQQVVVQNFWQALAYDEGLWKQSQRK